MGDPDFRCYLPASQKAMPLDRFVVKTSRLAFPGSIAAFFAGPGAGTAFVPAAKPMKSGIALLFLRSLSPGCFLLLSALSACKEDKTPNLGGELAAAVVPEPVSPWHDVPGAEYVGAETCRSCHEQEYNEWLQSDHFRAMELPTEKTVHGDFNDATFEHFGHTWRFFRKGEEFWVNAEDENGERKDYKIDYTFGFEPLQQYLIAFPGGRYQALQVCWDSRRRGRGAEVVSPVSERRSSSR